MNELQISDLRIHPGDSGFLIDDGETAILYDSGFGFTGERLALKIKKLLKDRKLDYIFLSHSHYDHVLGSAWVLKFYPEAKVVAGEYTAEIFQRQSARKKMMELDMLLAEKCGVTQYDYPGELLKVDIAAKDGMEISAGKMKFQIIALPGHTKCTTGFYEVNRKFFLAPETLGVYNGADLIIPACLVSFQDTLNSIGKVESLPVKMLMIPHLGVLDEEKSRFFLENMRSQAENSAQWFCDMIKSGTSDEDIFAEFRKKYLQGDIKEIYPEDAAALNTSIMLKLFRQELAKSSVI